MRRRFYFLALSPGDVVEERLVGRPAALFFVQPEGLGTNSFPKVHHPRRTNVYHRRDRPGRHANHQDADPARPGVVGSVEQVAYTFSFLAHYPPSQRTADKLFH